MSTSGAPGTGVVLRLLASVVALGVGTAAIVVVVILLRDTPGPVASTTTAVAPAATTQATGGHTPSTFPAPPRGAVVFTHQDGGTVLALAGTPPAKTPRLQASALGQPGGGAKGLGVSFTVGGRSARATACGPGCYRATLPAPAQPRAVDVTVSGSGLDTRWHQRLPAAWPAPSGAALMQNANHVWRSLKSLAYVEHLASDPAHAVTSTWRGAAPARAGSPGVGGYGGRRLRREGG